MALFLITLGIVALIVLFFWIGDETNMFGFIALSAITAALLLFWLLWLGGNYIDNINFAQTYPAIKTTIEESRSNPEFTYTERVELTSKIVELNADLAADKYWNQTIFDPCIPDEIVDFEPIK